MRERGISKLAIARELGISRAAIRDWENGRLPRGGGTRCEGSCREGLSGTDYAYLLGVYLGDRTISKVRNVFSLRIFCFEGYPGIIHDCMRSMQAVRPNPPRCVGVRDTRCVVVQAYSAHWPHLFPQMGPGMKHTRTIALEPWQREIARAHPEKLIRGLIHSDGCRVINRIHKNGKTYAYPRYHFSNESTDIIRIFTDALDQLGIEWRMNRPNSVSVARRASVAALDVIVGPKT